MDKLKFVEEPVRTTYKAVVFRNREYRLICVAVIAMRPYCPNTLPLDLFRLLATTESGQKKQLKAIIKCLLKLFDSGFLNQ
jgi:hypothetical protein